MIFGVARVSGALLLCALAACKGNGAPASSGGSGSATKAPPAQEPGAWYHARLIYKDVGELPFFLHLPAKGTNGRAYVVNGAENTDFTAEWQGNAIKITGHWNYVSVIEATLHPQSGTLEGTWTRDTPLWGEVVRDFVATPIDKPDPVERFPGAQVAPATSVGGIWEFRFAAHEEGKGILEQSPDGVVRGYIKPGQLGDIRFLAGNLQGSKLSLSHFNGNAANLVLGDVSPDGTTITGMMSMQNMWNEKFTAKRVDDFEFVNKVKLKAGKQSVSLLGLDKYKGKPTLAIIFATWCSSCNDAAPFLRDLYTKYHPRGLEMMAVA